MNTHDPISRITAACDVLRDNTNGTAIDELQAVLLASSVEYVQATDKPPVTAVNAAIVQDGKMLLMYKPKYNQFSVPGGKYNLHNDTPLDALKRELKEETGLNIEFLPQEDASLTQLNSSTLEKKMSEEPLIGGIYLANFLPAIFEDPNYAYNSSIQELVKLPGNRTIYLVKGSGNINNASDGEIATWVPLADLSKKQYEPNTHYFLREQAVIGRVANILESKYRMKKINRGVVFQNENSSIYVQNWDTTDNRTQHIDLIGVSDDDLNSLITELTFEVKPGIMNLTDGTSIWQLHYTLPYLTKDSTFPVLCEISK